MIAVENTKYRLEVYDFDCSKLNNNQIYCVGTQKPIADDINRRAIDGFIGGILVASLVFLIIIVYYEIK